jgi:hypothetical protein
MVDDVTSVINEPDNSLERRIQMQSKGSSTESSSLEIQKRGSAREHLLSRLRAAIGAQIQFWDVTCEIAEALRCDTQLVMDFATEFAITIDNPAEVGEGELNDFLIATLRRWPSKSSLVH